MKNAKKRKKDEPRSVYDGTKPLSRAHRERLQPAVVTEGARRRAHIARLEAKEDRTPQDAVTLARLRQWEESTRTAADTHAEATDDEVRALFGITRRDR